MRTIRQFLAWVPDGRLLESLRPARGRGRNDFPVHVLWGVLLLSILLRHETIEATLGELRRHADLRRLIGLERARRVPKKWNRSRFLDVLGRAPHRSRLHEAFNELVRRLGKAVPDLGRQTAGAATSLNARRKRDADQAAAEEAEGLAQPSGGRKEYLDESGNVTKVLQGYGYPLHLVVDVKHEVSLADPITSTKAGDGETLPAVLAEAQANLPSQRIGTRAFDKAADSNDVHQLLSANNIKPLIPIRNLWKEERARMLPGHDGNSNIVYDEAGTLSCSDRVSRPIVRHPMAYMGQEAKRGTLKYRCPARHQGWKCPSEPVCNAGRDFGLTVRVKRDLDLRRFPPIPRATRQFERLYNGRTAVERVNGRLKIFWGADEGNISGARRFHAFVGAVMVVHLGLATLLARTPRRAGTFGTMPLSPIAKALQAADSG